MSYQLIKLLWGLLPLLGLLYPLNALVRQLDKFDGTFPDLERNVRNYTWYMLLVYLFTVVTYILVIPVLITIPDYQVW